MNLSMKRFAIKSTLCIYKEKILPRWSLYLKEEMVGFNCIVIMKTNIEIIRRDPSNKRNFSFEEEKKGKIRKKYIKERVKGRRRV